MFCIIGGGVYLDTDIEVLKPFDSLLENKMFLGYEANDYVGTAVIGSEQKNLTVKSLLEFYESEIWNCSFFNNPIIFKYLLDNHSKKFENCKIYPQNFFSPYEPGRDNVGKVEKEETYAIHWYTKNWNMSRKGYVFLNTKHIKNPMYKIIASVRKNIGYFKYK